MRPSASHQRLRLFALWAALGGCFVDPVSGLPVGCGKVPIVDINAQFTIADVSWFEDEQTLFAFYRVDAEQGIGPESVIELTYRTDDLEVLWTPLGSFTPVHVHLPVDCGEKSRCGSISLRVNKVPRDVRLRMRYHRNGPLSLTPATTYNTVSVGPAHQSRSLVVYGVFDESNKQVQWRARHQFPTIRNEQATELGLRRSFRVTDANFGDLPDVAGNPYGYGASPICPIDFTNLPWPERKTQERAIFETNALPLSASTASGVCATATVSDAIGEFSTSAVARKNPETKGGFPTLRSPIRENGRVGFVLRMCNKVISQDHFDMQLQRLLIRGAQEICVDDFRRARFSEQIASAIKTRIDAERLLGKDMVIELAIHHDDATGALGRVLESALEQVLVPERDKSSPRVSGAFLLDSFGYRVASPTVRQLALWCPAQLISMFDIDRVPDTSMRDCPIQPDIPDLVLGPFRLNQLPILPTRDQYVKFIMKYSVAQSGEMKTLTFLAPERTAVSANVSVGDFGVATRFNNETISAAPTDAFSFCSSEDPGVARVVVMPVTADQTVIPLSLLPQVHRMMPFDRYFLGLAWESPFLLRAEYTSSLAASATVAGFTIPFGISSGNERFLGAEQWKRETFPLADALTQCTRFCDSPTFDSNGVYQPLALFRDAFETQCYRPKFPVPPEGGFPRDP